MFLGVLLQGLSRSSLLEGVLSAHDVWQVAKVVTGC